MKTTKTYHLRQASAHWEVAKAMYEQLKGAGYSVSGTLVGEDTVDNFYDGAYYRDVTITFSDYDEFLRFVDTVGDIVVHRNSAMDGLTIYDDYIE